MGGVGVSAVKLCACLVGLIKTSVLFNLLCLFTYLDASGQLCLRFFFFFKQAVGSDFNAVSTAQRNLRTESKEQAKKSNLTND